MCLSSIAGAVEYKAYQRLPLVSQFVNIFSLDIKKEVEYTVIVSIKSVIFELLQLLTSGCSAVVRRGSSGIGGGEGSKPPVDPSFPLNYFIFPSYKPSIV